MLSRRSFLASAAAALAYDPERELWVPGARTISVPAPRVRLSDAQIEALAHYIDQRLFAQPGFLVTAGWSDAPPLVAGDRCTIAGV